MTEHTIQAGAWATLALAYLAAIRFETRISRFWWRRGYYANCAEQDAVAKELRTEQAKARALILVCGKHMTEAQQLAASEDLEAEVAAELARKS